MKKRLLISAVGIFSGMTAVALPQATDHWRLDCNCSPQDAIPTLTSDQNPHRRSMWNAEVIAGVPGAVRQCVWCLPGAAGRLPSAVILPPKADFTFAFFVIFPEPLNGEQSLFHNPKMSVGIARDGCFKARLAGDEVVGGVSVADGRWHLLAVTRKGTTLALWLDGKEVASRENVRGTVYDDISTQWSVLDANNRNRMGLDEIIAWNEALDEGSFAEIMAQMQNAKIAPAFSVEDERRAVAAHMAADPPFAEPDDYSPLRIQPTALRSFAEQHDVNAVATPWFDPKGRDLVCKGTIFASAPMLYRFLRLENGVPVYAQAVPWNGPDPFSAVPWRGREGEVVWAMPMDRADKSQALVLRRGNPKTGEFDKGSIVKTPDGGEFSFFGRHLTFTDMDGDGIDDLVVIKNVSDIPFNATFPWPKGKDPWTDIESPYAGKGRGYDIFGRWMGVESVSEVHWAKGSVGGDGLPRFAALRLVLMDVPDFPGVRRALTWKTHLGATGVAAVETSEGRNLVMFGDMERIIALPLHNVGEDVSCGEVRPLLASGYDAPHGYWIHRLTPVDFDCDGRKELMLDGNPGTVAVLKGDKPGTWTSNRAWIEGGAICGETLSSESRMDWDGDGLQDVIMADASGWFTFWRGTKDPFVYEAPRPFTVDGKPLCIKAGRNGSLQGEIECVWGYVKVIAGTWGKEKALITVDIKGDLLLHTPASKADPLALNPAKPFLRADGRPFKVAWRSRPDFVKVGFAGIQRDGLMIQDVDGDLAVAVPRTDGDLTLNETCKLRYVTGETMRLCGINGLFGRGHVAVVDWDGDGDEDIIFGTNGSCQKFFTQGRPWPSKASSFLLRNVGTRAQPEYARAECIVLRKSGKRLVFGWHNATPCVTDLDGDGDADLLVAAENGKVYAFRREDIACDATVVAGLKVNGLVRPLQAGAKPVFGWRVESDRAQARQQAYRLVVKSENDVLWDSGEVRSSASVGIAYAGKTLESARHYEWSVAVRDDRGVWSANVASGFSTGTISK